MSLSFVPGKNCTIGVLQLASWLDVRSFHNIKKLNKYEKKHLKDQNLNSANKIIESHAMPVNHKGVR